MGIGRWNITIIAMVGVFGFLLGSFGINSSNSDLSLQTDSVMAIGHLELILKDADGNIKQYQQTDNLIVDIGKNTMADLIFPQINFNGNATDNKFAFIGIGSSIAAVSASDTGLFSPVVSCKNSPASISGALSSAGTSAFITLLAFFDGEFGCNTTFSEAVIANSIDSGEILTRQAFPSTTIGSTDSLEVQWDITLG